MDKYSLRSIGYFLKVAETLNFTQASEELYITQPALSKCIKQLEDEIGINLFYRSTKKVELTPGGKLLYDEWKIWHDRSEELLHEARMLNGIGATKIRIGIVEFGGVMNKVIPVLDYYNTLHPELEIDFEILGYTDLRRRLSNGDLDFIITLNSEVGETGGPIHVRHLMALQLYIIIPKKNHFFNRERLDFTELKNETFCIFSDAYSDEARKNIINHCKAVGFSPKNVKYYSNMKSMEMALAHSNYITIGYDTFFENNNDFKLFPTDDLNGTHEMVFAWKGDLRKSMTEFFNYLQKELSGQTA